MLLIVNIAMLIFMLAPLLVVVWMSTTPTQLFILPFTDFSLRWYSAAFAHPGFLEAFWLSVRLAFVSSLISVVLSLLASYALLRGRRVRGLELADGLFMSPLIVPAVVFGIAMLQFINLIGLYNTFASLVLAHVIIVTPFSIRTLQSSLRALPVELEWAAENLGASRLTVLLRIVLPVCARGIMAAFLLAFLISFSEVTVTIFITGPGYQTLPVRIYNYLTDQVDPTVAAISTMLIVLSIVLALLLDRLGGLVNLKK
ncbi:MAG: ABC transporter permease [Hyphomicrobiaceae bacterium]|nr:ABC transporter permease [Hyphomicrobiaceae bacterium]